jgi:hypothetical protein
VEDWPIGGSLEDIAQRARLLIAFADGFEESGLVVAARRMRVVARDSLELALREQARAVAEGEPG